MKILKCPICNSQSHLEVNPMWKTFNGTTHGYYDSYSYKYKCPKCNLVNCNGADTVYTDKDKVQDKAIVNWNKRVNEIRVLMGKKEIELERELK